MHTMKRALLLILLLGCYEPRRRDPDWDFPKDRQVPPGNFMVTTTTYEAERAHAAGLDIAFRYRDDTWSVQVGDAWTANGMNLFVLVRGWEAALKQYTRTSQVLMTMDGAPASMEVSEATPVPVARLVIWGFGGAVIQTYDYIITGASMEVTPRRIDRSTVELHLVPVISTRDRGRIRLNALQTQVRVPIGRDIVIMAHDEKPNSFAHGFFWWRAGGRERRIMKVVRVDGE